VIRIAISIEAFEAIERTMPLGRVAVDPEADAKGKRTILLSPNEANRLKALRRAGENYSDVILRLAAESG
jgi:hypothetical protein